jgi:hypothetical protein
VDPETEPGIVQEIQIIQNPEKPGKKIVTFLDFFHMSSSMPAQKDSFFPSGGLFPFFSR